MAMPNTPLMMAPSGSRDPFGRTIESDELVRGLRCINPNLRAWEEHSARVWFPGQGRINCLWLGEPGLGGRKIAAYPLGPVPEFTQLVPNSDEIMLLGWREIFEDVIKAGAASKGAIERQFKVSLEYEGNDSCCEQCRRFGTVREAQIDGLCRAHWAARAIANRVRTAR